MQSRKGDTSWYYDFSEPIENDRTRVSYPFPFPSPPGLIQEACHYLELVIGKITCKDYSGIEGLFRWNWMSPWLLVSEVVLSVVRNGWKLKCSIKLIELTSIVKYHGKSFINTLNFFFPLEHQHSAWNLPQRDEHQESHAWVRGSHARANIPEQA